MKMMPVENAGIFCWRVESGDWSGDVIRIDNIDTHQSETARQAIAACGARRTERSPQRSHPAHRNETAFVPYGAR
jgi:hypothetical protein